MRHGFKTQLFCGPKLGFGRLLYRICYLHGNKPVTDDKYSCLQVTTGRCSVTWCLSTDADDSTQHCVLQQFCLILSSF